MAAGDAVPGQPGNFYNQYGGVYQVGLPATTQAWTSQFATPQQQLSTPPPAPLQSNQDEGSTSATPAAPPKPKTTLTSTVPRIFIQSPDGRIQSGLADGSKPKDFNTVDDMHKWMSANGEDKISAMEAPSVPAAINLVRKWTGNPGYGGYTGANYQPPTPTAGSPAQANQDFGSWFSSLGSWSGLTAPGGGDPNDPKSVQPGAPGTGVPGSSSGTVLPPPPSGATPPPAPAPIIPPPPGQQLSGGTASPITPTTSVNPPTVGGTGNPATATGPNSTTLPSGANWQDILKFLTNFGLNRSLGSNNLIDLATQQLTNAQGRTNAIDQQQSTVTNFINSMIAQANTASGTRDQLVQGILNNTGLANGPGGATTPTVMQNAATLLNQMLQSSNPGINPNTGQPGSGQQFDPTGYRNAQINSFINLAGQAPPGMTDESKAALRLNQSELIPQQFNSAIEQARQQLQSQGALGGEQPGSQSDMTRTLAPIYAARAGAYSGLNANNILQNEMLKQQQLQQQRQLGLSALGQGVSLDQLSLQNILSNRGLANQLISTLGGITTGTAGLYNPTQYNALAQGGIGDLINLINSGTGALQTGNQAVNAATGAYAAGNQPLQTATGAGETLAQQSPSSFTQMLLNALLSTGANNASGIAGAIKGIDWGKIFGGAGSTVTNLPGSTSTGDSPMPNDYPGSTTIPAFNFGG